MRFLIVTPNFTLRDSLRMVISGLTDAEIITARDCPGARERLLERPVDFALIDGHLPMDDLRALLREMATLRRGIDRCGGRGPRDLHPAGG
ncbi:MAG: hypothetical protein MUC34_12520 [Anaerolineae bacterium]|nr:hypothetical protein [Anaerolineae bacterium]